MQSSRRRLWTYTEVSKREQAMNEQEISKVKSRAWARSVRLIALTLVGALVGRACFSAIFQTRDGIHLEYVAWQLRGTLIGAIVGVSIELARRELEVCALLEAKPQLGFRFRLRALLIATMIIAGVMGVFATR